MKKLITSVLAIMITLTCFVGCSGKTASNTASNKGNKSTSSSSTKSVKAGSKSWHDYSIVIDGTELKFPMSYKDFTSKGFKLYSKNDPTEDINLDADVSTGTGDSSGILATGVYTDGKTDNLAIHVHNTTGSNKNITECTVEGIYFLELHNPEVNKYKLGTITVKDLTTGKSATVGETTIKDIEKNFGARLDYKYANEFIVYPDKNGDGVTDTSEIDGSHELKMVFDTDSGKLSYEQLYYINQK